MKTYTPLVTNARIESIVKEQEDRINQLVKDGWSPESIFDSLLQAVYNVAQDYNMITVE